MNFGIRGLVVTTVAALLAACGGGGGGSPASVAIQPVAITQANAKPVAASALDSAQNTSAAQGGSGLLLGVQVEADAAPGPSTFLAMAEAARIAAVAFAPPASNLPVGVAISETQACPLGGTISVSGNVSGSNGLFAGDTVSLSANSCQLTVGGVSAVLNGSFSMTIVSGSVVSIPYHVVIAMTANNLSVQSGGSTVVTSGDIRLDWTVSSLTAQTLVATGSSITSRETTGGATHSITLKNYTQSLSINGSTISSVVTADVETDSTLLGTGGGSYAITTPVAVTWNAGTGVVSAGRIQVVGASSSKLVLTVGSGGVVTIQVDANGDGAFEATISGTVAELKALL